MKNKKKILLLLGIIVCIGGIIGGYRMLTKETLTKRQQDNVVRWIARSYYPVNKVEFTKFNQDKKTGTYLLSIKLNNNNDLVTTIAINDLKDFDEEYGTLGLSPVSRFEFMKREDKLEDYQQIDISNIKKDYLGGK
ncbi:hypothetical protein AB3331_04905 [Streptococcus sp. H49]|uniref:hypothetical protein n=1 Tax=Streptococcus huangxiaojuni TaxID=3237239 RepID=UPI0034A53BAD